MSDDDGNDDEDVDDDVLNRFQAWVRPSAPRSLNIRAILPVSKASSHRFRFKLCAPLLPFFKYMNDDGDDDDDGENIFSSKCACTSPTCPPTSQKIATDQGGGG